MKHERATTAQTARPARAGPGATADSTATHALIDAVPAGAAAGGARRVAQGPAVSPATYEPGGRAESSR